MVARKWLMVFDPLMRGILIWPSIWFGLWHFIPGSIFHDNVISLISLMVGAGLMDAYLSYLTKKLNTLWWSIVTHILGAIIMIA